MGIIKNLLIENNELKEKLNKIKEIVDEYQESSYMYSMPNAFKELKLIMEENSR